MVASLSANAADWGVTAGAGMASIANDECDAVVSYNVGAKVNFDLSENLFVEGSGLLQTRDFLIGGTKTFWACRSPLTKPSISTCIT